MKNYFNSILEKHRKHIPLTFRELLFENAAKWGSITIGVFCGLNAFFFFIFFLLGEKSVLYSVVFGGVSLALILVGVSVCEILDKNKWGAW